MSFIGVAVGGAGLIGSLVSGSMQSSAAEKASQTQAQSQQQAQQLEQTEFNQIQQNQQPFLQGGYATLGKLLGGIQGGQFGSQLAPPTAFQAPTLASAMQDPGYQFTAQQGSKGILEGSAAAGGAISGGTLKSLSNYNTNLANTTYNDVFNRSLSTYGAGLQQYNSQLQGQQQAFNQLLAPTQLGEGAVNQLAGAGQQYASAAGQNIVGAGNSLAAGTVGSANAWSNALGSGINSLAGGLSYGIQQGKLNSQGNQLTNQFGNDTVNSQQAIQSSGAFL